MAQPEDTGPVTGAVAQTKPPSVLEQFGSSVVGGLQETGRQIERGLGLDTAKPEPRTTPPSVTEQAGEFTGAVAPYFIPSALKAARGIPRIGPALGVAGDLLSVAEPVALGVQARGAIKERQDAVADEARAQGKPPPVTSGMDEVKADIGALASAALQHYGIGAVGKAIEGVLPGATTRIGQAAKAALAGGASMAGAGVATVGVERAAAGQPVTGPEATEEYKQAALTGGIGGGIIAGGAGALHRPAFQPRPNAGPIERALGNVENPVRAHVESAQVVGEPPLAQANQEAQAQQQEQPTIAKAETDNTGRVTHYTGANGIQIPASRDLDEAGRQVEQRAADQVIDNPEKAVADYRNLPGTDGGRIISTDEAREIFPDYNAGPEGRSKNSLAVHEPASLVAKQVWREELDRPVSQDKDATVFFAAGGTGAGKTSAIRRIPDVSDQMQKADIVYDGNLQSFKSAQEKIDAALESGRNVNIVYTHRDPIDAFVNGALPRAARESYGRTVPIDAHISTHTGAAKTISQLADFYKDDPRVDIQIVNNKTGEIPSVGSLKDVEPVAALQYNDLKPQLIDALKQEHANGKIPQRVWDFYRNEVQPEGSRAQPEAGSSAQPEGVGQASGAGLGPQAGRQVPAFSAPARAVQDEGGVRGGDGLLPQSHRQAAEDGRRDQDGSLLGLPRRVGGDYKPSVDARAAGVAEEYMRSRGETYSPPNQYARVVPERATRIAQAYDAMKHEPDNPVVKRAYDSMIAETLAQYQAIAKTGLKVDFIDPRKGDPYEGNPRKMIDDVRNNNHMWVFSTRDGFGSDASFDASQNPLLGDSGVKINGKPALHNDIFRIVHDYFGHVKEGVGFRADGEENAWRAHSAMYSPEARKAMTSETRGQNSWVNYGPHGEKNRTASSGDTVYADQKIGLLPDWVLHEGATDEAKFARPDAGRSRRESEMAAKQGKGWSERPIQQHAVSTDAVHYSNTAGLARLDGAKWGTNHVGAEAARVLGEGGITNRVYFYPSDSPLAPRGESVVGRAARYRQKLDNIYDARTDPLDLRGAADAAEKKGKNWANAFERAVVRAGYDGYRTHDMAVVLGSKKGVDVTPFSRGEGGGREIESLAHELAGSRLGRALVQLERQGKVELVHDTESRPWSGMWHDGKAVLNAAHIRHGEALGVTLHELGVHGARLGDILTPAGLDRYNRLLDRMTGKDAEFVRRADDRIPGDTPDVLRKEERLAYFVEEAANASGVAGGIASRIIAKLKAAVLDSRLGRWLEERGVKLGAQDMVELARAAVTKAGAGKASAFSRPTFFSALTRAIEGAKGAPKKGGEALSQWLDGAQRRGEIKKGEREWLGVDQWLKDHPQATREELAQFIRSNQVNVETVKLGNYALTDAEKSELDRLESRARSDDLTREEWKRRDDLREKAASAEDRTKFGSYVLPGGENYREHLLTLPMKKSETKTGEMPEGYSLINEAEAARAAGFSVPEGRESWSYSSRTGSSRLFDSREAAIADAIRDSKIGGENVSAGFRSSHFDEPNILAHVRMNDRITSDGSKALHIEEIQSDWHQKGRREGYQGAAPRTRSEIQPELKAALARDDNLGFETSSGAFRAIADHIDFADRWELSPDTLRLANEWRDAESGRKPVPDAPLKNTEEWAMLGFKHALREAVETGKDKVTWTTGEQQAERYDLSKQVRRIYLHDPVFDENGKFLRGHVAAEAAGHGEIVNKAVTAHDLPDVIGKEAADRITNNPTRQEGRTHILEGNDLKIGGEGMRGFYDKILPKAVEKYVKQWGGKVGESEIATGGKATKLNNGRTEIRDRDGYPVAAESYKVHSVDITPAMRESVREGQPLFSIPKSPKEILGRRAKYLTSDEFKKQRRDTAQKLVDLLEQFPSKKEYASAALAGRAKRGWYRDSARAIVSVFGDKDAPRFTGLLAALSPQTSVEVNLRNALKTWATWVKEGRPTDQDAIVNILGRSVEGDKGEKSVLGAWINNSVRALSTENAEQIQLSGPKVHSFMHNLRGAVDEVTNDAWMANFALVNQTMFKGGLTKGGDPGKGPGYIAQSVRVRQAAEYLTKLTGEKWTPAEVQETVWSWAKTAYELSEKTGRSVSDLVKSGEITDDLIKSTPAFGELFHEDQYRKILESAGLGGRLVRDNGDVGSQVAGAGREARAAAPNPADLERSAARLGRLRAQRAEEERRKQEEAELAAVPFSRPRAAARAVLNAQLRERELVRNVDRAAWAERDRAISEADNSVAKFRDYFDRMMRVTRDPRRLYASIIQYQQGQQITDQKARPFIDTMAKLFDRQASEIRRYGEDKLGLLDNYVPQIWKDAGRAPPRDVDAYTGPARKPLGGRTGFRKERVFGDYEEGMNAGLVPEFENPVDAVMARYQAGERYLSALAIRDGIERLGLLKKVANDERVPEGYARVNDGLFSGHAVPELVARDLNNYLAPGLGQFKAWRNFRWLQNILLSARLGFSAFHAGFTTVDAAMTHLDLGMRNALGGDVAGAVKHLAQVPLTPIKALAELFNRGPGSRLVRQFTGQEAVGDANTAAVLHALVQGGARARMDPTDWNNDLTKVLRAWKQGGIKELAKTPLHLLGATLEGAMRPISHYLVPAQKMVARVELMKYELDRVAQQLGQQRGDYAGIVKAVGQDALRQIAHSVVQRVDDRLGQMAYDNLFWNRMVKDIAQASIQSVGWNVGTYNVVFGGLRDIEKVFKPQQLLTPLDAAGQITNHQMSRVSGRLSYLIALNLGIGMLGAITQKLLTGEGPQELKDYFFPKTGQKNLDGTDSRISYPSYVKDEFGFSRHPLQTIEHKLHPSFSMIAELLNNKDFYGNHIYNPDDGWQQIAKQVGEYIAGGFRPYALQNQQQIKRQGGSVTSQLLPFVGVTPAPGDETRSEFQNYVRDSYAADHPRDAKTPQEVAESQKWFDVVDALRRGEQPDMSQLSAKERASAIKYAKTDVIASHFAKLSLQQQLAAYHRASSEERQSYRLRALILKGMRRHLASIDDPEERRAIIQQVKELQ